MKISEQRLNKVINEAVKKGLKEYMLKEQIKGIVRETFESMGGFSQFEASDSEDNEPKPLKKSQSGKADFNDENQDEQERRAQVEKFFNQDGVDIAPYAYQLYHVEKREGDDTNEMKNARSKFMKCLNHEPNEAGYPYSFSSDETNKLQSMISSNQLNEAINGTSFLPPEIRVRFFNTVRNAVHGGIGQLKRDVEDFYRRYRASAQNPRFTLDNLMKLANNIESEELGSVHTNPELGPRQGTTMDFDDDQIYEAVRKAVKSVISEVNKKKKK